MITEVPTTLRSQNTHCYIESTATIIIIIQQLYARVAVYTQRYKIIATAVSSRYTLDTYLAVDYSSKLE